VEQDFEPLKGRPSRRENVAKTQNVTRVEIYDQEYDMRGDLDAEYIQRLAKFLDLKMRSIAARTNTVDSLRVAVLAALNLADEYHQLKAKYEETTKQVEQKVEEYTEVLDELLKQAV
jgi:cell division protein ZapA